MKNTIHMMITLMLFSISAYSQVVINEAVSSNWKSYSDDENENSDWIELHNSGDQPADLTGWRISDKKNFDKAWRFDGLVIPPGGYKVIFASDRQQNGSDKIVLEGRNTGILSYHKTDSYLYGYKKIKGDFEISTRITHFSGGEFFGGAGLMARKGNNDTSIFSSIMAANPTSLSFKYFSRDADGQKLPFVMTFYHENEFPYTYLTLARKGDILTAAVTNAYKEPYHTHHDTIDFEDDIMIGIVLGSQKNSIAKAVFSDVLINGEGQSAEDFTVVNVGPEASGFITRSDEVHAGFGLSKDGDKIFLWDAEGDLQDEMDFGYLPGDMAYGRDAGNTSEKGLLDTPTPGFRNVKVSKGRCKAPEITLSKAIEQAMQVRIDGEPDMDIRYTLDGSEPDASSLKYEGAFETKSTVVRATGFKPGFIKSEIVTRTNFENLESAFPIVCISTHDSLLFDKNYGLLEGGYLPYNHEAKVNLEYFDKSRDMYFNSVVGLQVNGRAGRGLPQLGLKFYMRGGHDSKDLGLPIFGDNSLPFYNNLAMRNTSQDWDKSFLRDWVNQILLNECRYQDALNTQPVSVFLNGEYYGILLLRERYTEDYIAAKYGIAEEDVNLLDNFGNIKEGEDDNFRQTYQAILETDPESEDFEQEINAKIDVRTFVDYIIFGTLFINGDWVTENLRYWNTAGKPWKFQQYDTDITWNYYKSELHKHYFYHIKANDRFYSHLFFKMVENKGIKRYFLNRACDMINTVFSNERLTGVLDSTIALLNLERFRHMKRWPGSLAGWKEEIETLYDFAGQRPQIYKHQLRELFEPSEYTELTVGVNDTARGSLVLNTLDIDAKSWSGEYFGAVPVTLSAVPKKGYKFIRWSVKELGNNDTITFLASVYENVEAFFVPSDVTETPHEIILINEILYKPADGEDTKDWVELYNRGNIDIDLGGCYLLDNDDSHEKFFIPAGTILQPGAYLVLCEDRQLFEEVNGSEIRKEGDFDFGLGAGGDAVRLYDASGNLMDEVIYTGAFPWPVLTADGFSIELTEPDSDNSRGENWNASGGQKGTPGLANSPGTGIEDDEPLTDIKVYPQPAASDIVIDCGNATDIDAEIISLSGEALYEGTGLSGVVSVDVSDYTPGTYYLRCHLGKAAVIRKIIIRK